MPMTRRRWLTVAATTAAVLKPRLGRAETEIQFWHAMGGALGEKTKELAEGFTRAAWDLTRKQGFYEKNPGTEISILQMTGKPPTENSKGLRLGNFVQIRDVIDEELEAVWAGKKPAKEALDAAVRRGNELLRQFERAHR